MRMRKCGFDQINHNNISPWASRLMTSARIAMTNDITPLFQYRYRCSFFNFGEHQTTKRKILKSEVTLTMKFALRLRPMQNKFVTAHHYFYYIIT